MLDIQDYTPCTPTVYLLVPTITLNKAGHDSEIVCGIYAADRRTAEPHDEYCGIGSRPWKYSLTEESRLGFASRIPRSTSRAARAIIAT